MKWFPDPSVPSASRQRGTSCSRNAARPVRAPPARPPAARPWPTPRGWPHPPTAAPRPRSRSAGRTGHGPRGPRRELRADGDHAAADVDPDGGRDDRPVGRDDGPDGRTLAEVGVGHQRDVRVDEGHRGGDLGLPARPLLQHGRPVHQLLPQPLHVLHLSARVLLVMCSGPARQRFPRQARGTTIRSARRRPTGFPSATASDTRRATPPRPGPDRVPGQLQASEEGLDGTGSRPLSRASASRSAPARRGRHSATRSSSRSRPSKGRRSTAGTDTSSAPSSPSSSAASAALVTQTARGRAAGGGTRPRPVTSPARARRRRGGAAARPGPPSTGPRSATRPRRPPCPG